MAGNSPITARIPSSCGCHDYFGGRPPIGRAEVKVDGKPSNSRRTSPSIWAIRLRLTSSANTGRGSSRRFGRMGHAGDRRQETTGELSWPCRVWRGDRQQGRASRHLCRARSLAIRMPSKSAQQFVASMDIAGSHGPPDQAGIAAPSLPIPAHPKDDEAAAWDAGKESVLSCRRGPLRAHARLGRP
jgi:hypothetical protein